MTIDDFKNKKVAILGLGMEGIALADFLDGKVKSITLLDQFDEEELRKRAKEENNKKLTGIIDNKKFDKVFGEDYLNNLDKFDLIFRSPGLPYLKILKIVKDSKKISSQIKLFFDLCPAKIIGVTGTKGKGTTASLIEAMMQKPETQNPKFETDSSDQNKNQIFKSTNYGNVFLAGNIGKPAIALLDKIDKDDWVILELSSFQLQDLEKSPNIATIVNMAVDHLDYHKDEEEYFEAKTSIVRYQNKEDTVIANMDFKNALRLSRMSKAEKLYFSGNMKTDAYIKNAKCQIPNAKCMEVILFNAKKNQVICRSDQINLVGKHNLENIAAAALTAKVAGASIESIKKGARSFHGLVHRIEFVKEIEGIRFYNDSFATNPEPTMAALRSFSEPITIILGGSSKGANFDQMAKEIENSTVTNVILIGKEAKKIGKSLKKSAYNGRVEKVNGDISNIVREAKAVTKSGGVVLFSPACASFDMFKNYKERGEQFTQAVKRLK